MPAHADGFSLSSSNPLKCWDCRGAPPCECWPSNFSLQRSPSPGSLIFGVHDLSVLQLLTFFTLLPVRTTPSQSDHLSQRSRGKVNPSAACKYERPTHSPSSPTLPSSDQTALLVLPASCNLLTEPTATPRDAPLAFPPTLSFHNLPSLSPPGTAQIPPPACELLPASSKHSPPVHGSLTAMAFTLAVPWHGGGLLISSTLGFVLHI